MKSRAREGSLITQFRSIAKRLFRPLVQPNLRVPVCLGLCSHHE